VIDTQPIAAAFARVASMFRENPGRALNTAVSRARIENGLTCHVEEGPWRLVADMSKGAGGAKQGPTPGVLGRAALGSCLAIGFVMEAARAGVPIESVEVEVQTDFDDGALFGVSDAHPGYLDVRYEVSVTSAASEEDLRRVAEAADARSPYLDVFSRAQTMHRSLKVVRPGGG
jgi:uncharacterized OsmC-like protein